MFTVLHFIKEKHTPTSDIFKSINKIYKTLKIYLNIWVIYKSFQESISCFENYHSLGKMK